MPSPRVLCSSKRKCGGPPGLAQLVSGSRALCYACRHRCDPFAGLARETQPGFFVPGAGLIDCFERESRRCVDLAGERVAKPLHDFARQRAHLLLCGSLELCAKGLIETDADLTFRLFIHGQPLLIKCSQFCEQQLFVYSLGRHLVKFFVCVTEYK
jgi:hypothetical protein